jgi:hypothetical protein
VLEAGVAEDIQPPDEPGREERTLQILRVVAQELQRTEDLQRAPAAIFPFFVRPVPLRIAAGQRSC